MQITNMTELSEFFNENRMSNRAFTLYIYSPTHGRSTIDFAARADIVFTSGTPYCLDYQAIAWVGSNGNMMTRSLQDMNIPENNYNDWRAFTTVEEAEEYRNPTPKERPFPKLMTWGDSLLWATRLNVEKSGTTISGVIVKSGGRHQHGDQSDYWRIDGSSYGDGWVDVDPETVKFSEFVTK